MDEVRQQSVAVSSVRVAVVPNRVAEVGIERI